MKTAAQLLCLVLILFLFATNIYRAATQSITIDEAFTYNKFVWPQLQDSLSTYDANHHVLHTLLCKLSVRWFGLSEFGLRVPSLCGGLLFLISVWRLSRYVLGRGWFCLFALAAVTLNPMVLDYLSAARGYGLALGFFFWALLLLTRYLAEDYDPPAWVLYRAGIALGLSVASNLVFLVPAVAVGTVFGIILLAGGEFAAPLRARFWLLVDRFFGPALAIAFVVLVLPLSHAQSGHFYYGARTVDEMVQSLVSYALAHTLRVWRLARYLPGFPRWTTIAAHVVLPAIAALVLLTAGWIVQRWARVRNFLALGTAERATLMVAGTGALSFLVLIAAHKGFGVLYPLGRTGAYWPPLFTFAVMLTIAWLWRAGTAGRIAAAWCGGIVVIAMGLFVAGFTTNQYPQWRHDAGTRRIVDLVRGEHRPASSARVRLGINPLFEPSINFYRHKYHLDWIEPVTRAGPDGDYDMYVLLPENKVLIEKRGLRAVYRDPVSEAVLALPPTAGGKMPEARVP